MPIFKEFILKEIEDHPTDDPLSLLLESRIKNQSGNCLTSAITGIEGAAPGRETAMAAAWVASRRHSWGGSPAASAATK